MDTMTCTKCGVDKPATSEYFPPRSNRGTLHRHCRECENAYRRKRAKEHPEARSRREAAFIEAVKKDPARLEKLRERKRRWQRNNPFSIRVTSANRHARNNKVDGTFTVEQLKEVYAWQDGCCAYCEQLLGDDWQIDHTIALCREDSTNTIDNITCVCPTCNKSKGDRTPEEWVNRWYLREDSDGQES